MNIEEKRRALIELQAGKLTRRELLIKRLSTCIAIKHSWAAPERDGTYLVEGKAVPKKEFYEIVNAGVNPLHS